MKSSFSGSFISAFFSLRGNPRKGFTLVEIITALAILMVGITFTSRTFVLGMRQKARNNNLVAAHFLASGKIEETFTGELSAEGKCEFNENLSWKRELRESRVPGLLEVGVTVKWQERGAEKTYSLTTLIRDDGH